MNYVISGRAMPRVSDDPGFTTVVKDRRCLEIAFRRNTGTLFPRLGLRAPSYLPRNLFRVDFDRCLTNSFPVYRRVPWEVSSHEVSAEFCMQI